MSARSEFKAGRRMVRRAARGIKEFDLLTERLQAALDAGDFEAWDRLHGRIVELKEAIARDHQEAAATLARLGI